MLHKFHAKARIMKFSHIAPMLICFGALLPLACSSNTDTSSSSGGDGGSGGSVCKDGANGGLTLTCSGG